jgi:YVTN family beta-propeller protein
LLSQTTQAGTDQLEFRILGSVEVASNGERLGLGGAKQRTLLALLLLHPNEVVSRDRIIDALWGERPPPTVAAALNVYVSKLRKIFGGAGANDVLVTQDPGYLLRVRAGQLDADRFAELAVQGRQALDAGNYQDALASLDEALSLWRGRALNDLAEEEFARVACGRLEEGRIAALIDRIDAALALGRATELVGDLEAFVAEHPYQERLWAELMLAFYRSGRQAEALDAYKRARTTLDELGIEPSPELKRLQSQILRQDPALQAPAKATGLTPPTAPRERVLWTRPLLLAVAAVVLLAGAAAGISVALTNDRDTSRPQPAAAPNSVRVIDVATNKVVASVPIGGAPGGLASGEDGIWVVNEDDDTLLHIDPRTMKVVQTIGVRGITDVVAGGGAVWAVGGEGSAIVRIPPATPDLSRTIPIRQLSGFGDPSELQPQIAIGAGSVWSLDGLAGIARIDARSGRIVSRISLAGGAPDEISFGAGSLWIVDSTNRQVIQLDASTERPKPVTTFGKAPTGIAFGFDAVWIGDYLADVVWRLNPELGRIERTIAVGQRPFAVAVGAGAVWVANSYDSTITKIDPMTNRVLRTIRVGYSPTRIVVARGRIWVITR